MARADDAQGGETKLVALKAVSEGYPLRGRLSLLSDLSSGKTLTRPAW
jgi:putative ABC transport system permease protein